MKNSYTAYSPSPAMDPSFDLCKDLERAVRDFSDAIYLEVLPSALPQLVNDIVAMSHDDWGTHLPLVSSTAFLPAREGGGPDWHHFDLPTRELKFVSVLYQSAFGVQVFDPAITSAEDLRGKKIAAPSPPSGLRVLTDALLRDGMGIIDDVEIVDMHVGSVLAAFDGGDIDATVWNIVTPSANGPAPLLPHLADRPHAKWIGMDEEGLATLNANNPFKLALTSMLGFPMLGVGMALLAWDGTDHEAIDIILSAILAKGSNYSGLPDTIAEMTAWPALDATMLHPAAARFYQRHRLVGSH